MRERGLRYVELHGGPGYRHLSWRDVASGRDKEIRELSDLYEITIIDIMFGGLNFLSPSQDERAAAQEYAIMLIQAAKQLGIPSVSVFTGRNPLLGLEENLGQLPNVLLPVLDVGQKLGVRVLLENCPMAHNWPPKYNIAIHPALWHDIFSAIPSSLLGLNFDPSHLVWQGIDYVEAVYRFADRIVLVQAKDSELLPHIQRQEGILGTRFWRHRIAGQGHVDWNRLISALIDCGYDGPLVIEHEDPLYESSIEAVQAGVDLSRTYLSQYLSMRPNQGSVEEHHSASPTAVLPGRMGY